MTTQRQLSWVLEPLQADSGNLGITILPGDQPHGPGFLGYRVLTFLSIFVLVQLHVPRKGVQSGWTCRP